MQFGLLISILLHAAILGGALVSIQSRQQLRVPESLPVAVGMISPSEVTKVRVGDRTAKLLEAMAKESPNGRQAKKKASKSRRVAAAAPPPPPPPPEPKSEPAARKSAAPPPDAAADAERKRQAEQREQARKAAEKKKAEAQRQAAEKKKAEAQRRAEEAQKRAEAQRRAEEERRAEERRKAEERKRAEERRKAEERERAEERRRAEERKKAEERRRRAEVKRKREAERKRREAKKREAERRRRQAEEEKKKRFDADKIAALLNKVPDAAPPPASAPPTKPTRDRGPTLGAPDGRDKQISASEIAMIVQAIKTCVTANWRVLSGGASAQETVVRMRLRFNQDGTLSEPPRIMNPQRTPYFVAISESARRAVRQCEPYDLPPAKYDVWKDLVMNFSPTDMY